jgi:hypothetical protein
MRFGTERERERERGRGEEVYNLYSLPKSLVWSNHET